MSQNGDQSFERDFIIDGGDFAKAGSVSVSVKNLIKQVGVSSGLVRRVAIVAFEAEMNVVMYGGGGTLVLRITPRRIVVEVADQGPGIADLGQAMQEGWSTATAEMRERGFGAGMGLPNMAKNSDSLDIHTAPGRGTRVVAMFNMAWQDRQA